MLLQEVLWVDFIFRHINSSKSYSGGFLSTWRPNRKSFENQAHFVSLSETSVHYFLCGINHESLLCELDNFDLTTQLPQDIMHTLLEGVVQYELRYLDDLVLY